MPKFTFECSTCCVQFSRNLKMGLNESLPCPSCASPAPRVFEGFGFSFGASPQAAPGNSGVTKHDYPTADQAIGSTADTRWEEIRAREKIKAKVRDVGGNRALIRRNVVEESTPTVEYEAGGESLVKGRKTLVQKVNQLYKAGGEKGR